MSDDPRVPKTPQIARSPVPPDPWTDATKTLVERAATLKGRPARVRLVLFQTLVSEMPMRRSATPTDAPLLADLFAAGFGDPTGGAFWRLRLSGPVDPNQFAELLATFLAIEGGVKATHKLALGVTLTRDLTAAKVVPPVVETAHSPIVGYVDANDGQHHLYLMQPTMRLEGESFDPMIPLRWMVERELYRDFLPQSLATFLSPGSMLEPTVDAAAGHESYSKPPHNYRTGMAGHPSSKDLVIAEMRARAERGETERSSLAAEARALAAWLKAAHPSAPSMKSHTMQNSLREEYSALLKQLPK